MDYRFGHLYYFITGQISSLKIYFSGCVRKNKICIFCISFILALPFSLFSKDLGKRGHTFPIKEENLLDHLREKIELSSENQIFMNETLDFSRYSSDLNVATETKRFYFDPTVKLERDIFDHKGKIIAEKGVSFNPLSIVSLDKDLILFDGTDPHQLSWAIDHGDQYMLILTKGNPLELEERFNRSLFFDYSGEMVKKFGIKHLPVVVSQVGTQLQILEYALVQEAE
ncbi:hypothetical protein N9Y92_00280 [Chlamydiales bacterium]|nr:hypothetical protein [Chlamydiales bacterium]